MLDSYDAPAKGDTAAPQPTAAPPAPYDKRKLSYANTFTNPWKANTIRALEWTTGKLPLIRLVRRFEREGVPEGQDFWAQALRMMRIELQTPAEQIARIPQDGPVIVVANHPHGLVDGMILAELIGRVRTDYRILTRSLLTGVQEIAEFMIPVPFPHEETAREQSLEMRATAMDHLKRGGVIALFPSGVVASSGSMFGNAIEAVWNPFTAKMIQRSGATVVPIYFPGQNSRAYQIANRLSPTLRQGLLIHEVIHACGRPQAPVVGAPISPEEVRGWSGNQREFVAWLRDRTLALKG
ncbi:lysophospholipid acyltransferase family protein [Yangia mangrovi]|uniref:Acyltransferase n=2 Tax=Alloyangia mangrovi TaxID=1779329 RepID=A0A2A3JV76_9RHOB|nr:lysophospholipid acyltransferase family protein [Alloyangia mangrovi]MCA0940486.1 lysophospholipid acyltransferase family protein [Alloyangia pacifica]MCA0945117.1 lysophospholipid acyltransferase family protein [Alloyangia pacifica]MCT4371479.1 lysophospholipid acyltransferase family protein [Alloyangia mangrovi]